MSRFKDIQEYPDDLNTLSIAELEKWLTYWKTRKEHLGKLPTKNVEKTIHKIEKAINNKRNESYEP